MSGIRWAMGLALRLVFTLGSLLFLVVGSVQAEGITPPTLSVTQKGNTQVSLSWVESGDGVVSYSVQRLEGSDFVTIGTVPATSSAYEEDNLRPNTSYVYQVMATTLPDPPDAPNYFSAYGVSSSEIDLSWQTPNGSPTSYTLTRTNPDNVWPEQRSAFGLPAWRNPGSKGIVTCPCIMTHSNAQGGDVHSQTIFSDHAIVQYLNDNGDSRGNKLYDPSYGHAFDSLQAWDDGSVGSYAAFPAPGSAWTNGPAGLHKWTGHTPNTEEMHHDTRRGR